MPRYFFHIHNAEVTLDHEGQELADDAAARREAMHSARDLICDDVRKGLVILSHHLDVEDADGRPLLTIRYGDAFEIKA